jgi:DNA transformation protein
MMSPVKAGKAFQKFVEEQLNGIAGLQFRKMFGGHGIYAGEVFFGILHGERLYFRTNEETRARYVSAGMSWFVTPGQKKSVKAYYEVPLAAIEQVQELRVWAQEAIKVANEVLDRLPRKTTSKSLPSDQGQSTSPRA